MKVGMGDIVKGRAVDVVTADESDVGERQRERMEGEEQG